MARRMDDMTGIANETPSATRAMRDDIARAVSALRAGEAVAFPTDTVFGVGVSVEHAASPQAIYDIKQREAGKPVTLRGGGLLLYSISYIANVRICRFSNRLAADDAAAGPVSKGKEL